MKNVFSFTDKKLPDYIPLSLRERTREREYD